MSDVEQKKQDTETNKTDDSTVEAIRENAKPASKPVTEEKPAAEPKPETAEKKAEEKPKAEASAKPEEPAKPEGTAKPDDAKKKFFGGKDRETEKKLKEQAEEIKKLKEESERLKADNTKLKTEYLKAYADTENTQKRLQRDFEQQSKYRIQSFAKEILPVLDNCERAMAVQSEDENYRKAFTMVHKSLETALKNEGVEEIVCLNQPYDPNWHQAMMMEHVEGVEPGMVTAVLQKGYKLKDRLLRAAMVKVSE